MNHEIQEIFLKYLPEDRQRIEIAWNNLRSSTEWGEKERSALMIAAHGLSGAALTTGYTRIGNVARLVENHLKEFSAPNRSVFEKLVAALFAEIDAHIRDKKLDAVPYHPPAVKNTPSLQETRSTSLIYLVDDDPVLNEAIATQLRHFGYVIQTFSRVLDLTNALKHATPAAILMDVMFREGELADINAVQALQAEHANDLPVFFLSTLNDISTRLQAIRAGGKGYFVKPVDIAELVDVLDKTITAEIPEPYRVLIVDDSEMQSQINAAHLETAGILSYIVNNPLEALNAFNDFIPDLLLFDLYMPQCTGLELAQVIRQMKSFVSVPIVYLSAEMDREKQLEAIESGGDDFLTKPIKRAHLISAVSSRIQRYRQLRQLMLRDSLTGLFNHTSIHERLEQEISRSIRSNHPLTFAMIDIDNFKKINDTYGHAAGDRILKALTYMLTRRLRQSDIIGRYGGDEFVIILPNTDENTAFQVIRELCEAFSLVGHTSAIGEFHATLSCGVAGFPKYQTFAELSEAADQAMYAAKKQGRNQAVLAR